MMGDTAMVTSLSSGKGGVGKTFVATNLGACLAAKGNKVLVVDCDLGLANIDIMLGINPKRSLKDVILGDIPLDEIVVHTKAGFDLVPGSSGIREMAQLMFEKVQEVKELLRPLFPRYNHVLLDTGAGISELVLQFNLLAGRNVVILTRELTSLTDAYAMIKVMFQLFGRDSFDIIVNAAEDEREGERIFRQIDATCKRFLGFSLTYLGYITRDDTVSRSILKQEVLVQSAPRSKVALDLFSIARNMGHRDVALSA